MAERQLCGCLHHSFSEASPRPFNRSPTGMPTREYTEGISYRTCFPSNPRESTFVHTIAPVLEDFHVEDTFGGVHHNEILGFLLMIVPDGCYRDELLVIWKITMNYGVVGYFDDMSSRYLSVYQSRQPVSTIWIFVIQISFYCT